MKRCRLVCSWKMLSPSVVTYLIKKLMQNITTIYFCAKSRNRYNADLWKAKSLVTFQVWKSNRGNKLFKGSVTHGYYLYVLVCWLVLTKMLICLNGFIITQIHHSNRKFCDLSCQKALFSFLIKHAGHIPQFVNRNAYH